MKKIFILTLMASALMIGCKDDEPTTTPGGGTGGGKYEVAEVQSGFVIDGTSTSTGGAGTYSRPAIISALAKYGSKLATIAVHLNSTAAADPFQSEDGVAFASGVGLQQLPTIFVARPTTLITYQGVNAANSSFSRTLDSLLNLQTNETPTAGIDLVKTVEESGVNAEVKVQYFGDSEDSYYVSCYLVEDGLSGQQVMADQKIETVTFNNVLRQSLSVNFLGDALPTGAKTDAQIDNIVFGDIIDASWNTANLKMVAVLWKSAPGATNRTFVNAVVK